MFLYHVGKASGAVLGTDTAEFSGAGIRPSLEGAGYPAGYNR